MFQATRRRLALWYTTVTAVLLLVFATAVYLYVRSTLIERVDDTLKHVVEVVERSLVIQQVDESVIPYRINVESSFRDNVEAVEDDRIELEWFSPRGELLWSTFSEPLDIPLHPKQTGETVYLADNHLLRQFTKRMEIGRYVLGYLRVSHPWFEVTKPIRQLIVDLTLATVVMILSTAAIGWLLSELAMKPVRESYQRLKQFTADASHELRNPIATIQTNVQVALADPDMDPQWQRQQLKVVERLTQRLGRLVNDLLFLARVDSGMVQPEWQTVPLDALLLEVIEEQQLVAAEKGIALSLHIVETPHPDFGFSIADLGKSAAVELDEVALQGSVSQLSAGATQTPKTDEDAFTLQGDWNQLARLFTNLVSNALQYTPSSTEELSKAWVQVQLQQLKSPGKGGRHALSLIQVQVRDNGIGISESALPHIFDRFYRADPARTYTTAAGSGLGLAIAKAIIENHHGNIQVESGIEGGTTVTVILPAYKPDAHKRTYVNN
ncbi:MULTISPECIES: sensor histidine kinase [unclassified Coleofasciculus]|uniref:sensor histidine kinase n=1 Tax=unclassified Coleofasciculus TaxID=2692782 RepID=UPI00187FB02D|nr:MULTISPECIES: HAMP domain-containing sensor histidine kinase [unclassified Coleofasciculus]MBE9130112.1 HAMP domain-containing histidine kinase [Coleofasciculus sp. LEGE 07081]MBE9147100.1 HAMP domain-containing histidine kinase [Coleofasciculus sp. LEGE 07092]